MSTLTKKFLEYRKAPHVKKGTTPTVRPQADFMGWKDNSETRSQRQDKLIELSLTHTLHPCDKYWLNMGGNTTFSSGMRSKSFKKKGKELDRAMELSLWRIGKYTKSPVGGFR